MTNISLMGPVIARPKKSDVRRRFFLVWIILGAAATLLGLAIGPRINSSRNPWISIVFAFAVYSFSVLLCDLKLAGIARRSMTSVVLQFSVPVGLAGLSVTSAVVLLGTNYLSIPREDMFGLAFAVGFLYAAAIAWAILTARGSEES